jgi:hypothetical protein
LKDDTMTTRTTACVLLGVTKAAPAPQPVAALLRAPQCKSTIPSPIAHWSLAKQLRFKLWVLKHRVSSGISSL